MLALVSSSWDITQCGGGRAEGGAQLSCTQPRLLAPHPFTCSHVRTISPSVSQDHDLPSGHELREALGTALLPESWVKII